MSLSAFAPSQIHDATSAAVADRDLPGQAASPPLASARGVMFGVLAGLVIWSVVAVLLVTAL